MKTIITRFLAILLLSSSLCLAKTTEWTIAVYMDTEEPDLHYWMVKNIQDMVQAKFDTSKVNVVVQVHLGKDEAWRFCVGNRMVKFEPPVSYGSGGGQNIIDFMEYTVKNYPATHYGLILSGCGFGILDPIFQPTSTNSFPWDVAPDEPGHECVGGVCPLSYELRGLMFNNRMQRFLNNTAMISMLKTIKEMVLKGQKLEFLGTDCCKMAMLEVGYQIKDFTNYLVGSQNCELPDGWNYKAFFDSFHESAQVDQRSVVQEIVKTYDDYYKKNTLQNTYTLSALDLSQFDPLVENINSVVLVCKKLFSENKPVFKSIALKARSKCPSMCQASYYVDFGALYTKLFEELDTPEAASLNTESVAALKKLLVQGLAFIKPSVVAQSLGACVSSFSGMSIYFPCNRIDESYFATPFAQETLWLSFLQEIIGE